MLEKLRLTDKEMAEVQGDKDVCLAIIQGFDTCEGCSANCRNVADAQLAKIQQYLASLTDKEVTERINRIIRSHELHLDDISKEELTTIGYLSRKDISRSKASCEILSLIQPFILSKAEGLILKAKEEGRELGIEISAEYVEMTFDEPTIAKEIRQSLKGEKK